MRLAPIPLFFHPDAALAVHYGGESSRTTHGAPECVDACRYFALILCRALGGAGKEQVVAPCEEDVVSAPAILEIAAGKYRSKTEDQVAGTGYVVRSLEAALWCFVHTESFEGAVLKAANLGDDADTTAAICGQVAGAFYGESSIPDRWLETLKVSDQIRTLADRLFKASHREA